MRLTLHDLARALGGKICGNAVSAPGPGHKSKGDLSLRVFLSATDSDGFTVHSFAGDDWKADRDYVRQKLNLPACAYGRARQALEPSSEPAPAPDNREKALRIWRRAVDPRGTAVETYLRGRGVSLPDCAAGEAIRFAPELCFRGKTFDAMVCLVRNIVSNEPQGIHITEILDASGGVRGDRFTYGPTKGGAIKLDPDENVSMGLFIGEGIETCLQARELSYVPVWAAINAAGIADFPVLSGIEALTIFEENDKANARATEACRARWAEAGREVIVIGLISEEEGADLNDLRGRIAP